MTHPETDLKTKNDHFQEMFRRVITHKQLKVKTILFDSWYSSVENLKLIHRAGWTFFTTLKSNRMVSLHRDTGYQHLDELAFSGSAAVSGLSVKLKQRGRPCDSFFGQAFQDSGPKRSH